MNISRHGKVLEINIEALPVDADIRRRIELALADAEADDAISSVILSGAGDVGFKIDACEGHAAMPALSALTSRVEACNKPVVAAFGGNCLGSRLELMMACHYRIATDSAKLGLPNIKVGVMPGAGGTQRLPRLVNLETALGLVLLGASLSAKRALEAGLIDAVAGEEGLHHSAIELAVSAKTTRRTGSLPVVQDDAAFDQFVAKNARRIAGLDAQKACIEAMNAAVTFSFEDGMAFEGKLFGTTATGQQARALRHGYLAERAAAQIAGLDADLPQRAVGHVGVVGAGTMGGGIAMNFLSAGIAVTIIDMTEEALERGVAIMRKNYEASAAKGHKTAEEVERAMALLTPSLDFDDLASCDLIIEAVFEDMELKKTLFRRFDGLAKPNAILASNTSFLNIDEIAQETSRPQDLLGLHFFSPANVMRLMEVVRGAATSPEVLATAMEIGQRIQKVAVVSGVCHGFIGNRMLMARQAQVNALVMEGARPEQVDHVHTSFGMPMGPFQMADLSGLDVGWHRDPERIEDVRDALCAAGRRGQKTSAGYYDYEGSRRPLPSPTTNAIIADFRKKAGIVPREIDDGEIIIRTMYTIVNEGAKILEEGIAQRSSDIDTVWLNGYGWPTVTGGPMYWADQIGAETILRELRRFQASLGSDFVIAPLLIRLAEEGKRFSDV